jgi:hypothetical protein
LLFSGESVRANKCVSRNGIAAHTCWWGAACWWGEAKETCGLLLSYYACSVGCLTLIITGCATSLCNPNPNVAGDQRRPAVGQGEAGTGATDVASVHWTDIRHPMPRYAANHIIPNANANNGANVNPNPNPNPNAGRGQPEPNYIDVANRGWVCGCGGCPAEWTGLYCEVHTPCFIQPNGLNYCNNRGSPIATAAGKCSCPTCEFGYSGAR